MVWALRAGDPTLAPASYYLKSASTYSVGRKGILENMLDGNSVRLAYHEKDKLLLWKCIYDATSCSLYHCYITIQTDKTISRLHANLITEEAKVPQTDINDVAHIPRMSLQVHDFSKFGTFVNKQPGSKPVNSLPGSEVFLNDGDVVTFGTNKTSFRVEFIPFFLCISATDVRKENPTSKYALRHGAYAVESWKEGCTHVLVDEGSAVTEMVIAAVAFSKPVVQINWWQKFSMETQVVTEMLPFSSYLPTLVFQGAASFTPIKIALPELRRNILQNYSFFLVPLDLYQHGKYLVRLLEAAGARVELLSQTASSIIPTGTRRQLVVKPRGGTVKEGWANPTVLNKIRHLPRTSEDKIVLAVLAGYVDDTSLPLIPSPVASADSDETREESDGNEDQDTAGTLSFKAFQATPPPSPPKAGMPPVGATATIPIDLDEDSPIVEVKRTSKRSRQQESSYGAEPEGSTEPVDDNYAKRQKVNRLGCVTEAPGAMNLSQDCKLPSKATDAEALEPTTRGRKRASMTIDKFFSQHEGNTKARKLQLTPNFTETKTGKELLGQEDEGTIKKEIKATPKAELLTKELPRMLVDSSGSLEADVVYCQLVVRKDVGMVPFPSTPSQGSAPNFKRFRKKGLGIGVSGNTFTALVPFAKEPYRESDLGRERNEFMQDERRRREAERIAEDLFHNEKPKNVTSKSRARAKK